ncbi:hypothetical protein A4A49_56709 [Nicotiana attenuata]|uniref:Uncharacterized protein n=1 Tax=Nicotiana attenuata TaxID=49451 RepID=A0A1J6IC51_NICAT|nr:hypothetical protein A4A49_56709 [Nicotiana attenuata]
MKFAGENIPPYNTNRYSPSTPEFIVQQRYFHRFAFRGRCIDLGLTSTCELYKNCLPCLDKEHPDIVDTLSMIHTIK